MGSAGGDDEARPPPASPAARPKPDRRAEALRANLKRRKAQTRARDEVRQDERQPAPGSDAPDRAG